MASFSNTSTFWTEYLTEVSCVFPALRENAAPANDTKRRTQPLSCQSTSTTISLHGDSKVTSIDLYSAAWAILLGRYLGTEQVCFGTIETTMSSSWYSAARVHLAKDQPASAVVLDFQQSRDTCRLRRGDSAREFSEKLGAERHLLNTAVSFNDTRNTYGSKTATLSSNDQLFDLVLCVRRSETSFDCSLEFSTAVLSDSAAALVAATYETIFVELTKSIDLPLERLCKLSSSDLDRTWGWNETCPDPVNALVHNLFRRNVMSQPNAPAVSASDASFTYRELDILSNILANFLVGQGVGPEVVVPLCFEKSAWATVAMLAVAKAGGAFTFLDSSYPISRLEDIVNQVDAKFILTSRSNAGCMDGLLPTFVVCDESLDEMPRIATPPTTTVIPSSLLYIIFTSGSTGKPKGVCVEHANYLSCALHQSRVCSMHHGSRVLQFASYSFDVSVLENFTTLVTGGCVCIPDDAARSKGIASIMNEFQITWAFLTPSLVKLIGPTDVPSLETLVLGGEALSKADVETWAGHIQLMNGYGPTECSIASAINPTLNAQTDAANIGWPVGGLLWVVDSNDSNQLVPIGAIGELVIEGPHLARGYLNDPVKTAAAFVENPDWMANFPENRKRRIYLTGDLVRCNPDGSIHFIGRKDTQVKIRGLRIELGDIEHHLGVDPLVNLAIVVAPTTGICQKRLVAVISLEDKNKPKPDGGLRVLDPTLEDVRRSTAEIQENLSRRVQNYMVPTTWLILESFPLTPSGKIDRVKVKRWIAEMDAKALSESECVLEKEAVIADGPSSTIEEALRVVIGQILNLSLESVIPTRSFVNLGGDSISAMRLMSQCKSQGLAIKVKDILRCKSISELATCVGTSAKTTIQVEDEYDVPFGLTPVQKLYFQLEPEGTALGGSNRFNQSFLLRLTRNSVSSKAVSAALRMVAERHSMLRARFMISETGDWQQFIPRMVEGTYRFKEHRLSRYDNTEQIILRSQADIDMINGPVFIADLINDSQGQLLSLIAHHAVVDLVSWRVIMQELEELIERGSLPAGHEKPLPFQTWHRLQLEYSKQHLTPSVSFPDKIEPANLEYWGMSGLPNMIKDVSRVVFRLDAATTSTLTGPECHRALRTEPVDLFLSAIVHSFSIVFHDRNTPTIFRESHGREPWDDSIDISSTVGWFTSMYPVHVDAAESFIDTVRRVKDTQRRVPRNGWPYFASRYNNPDGMTAFGSHPTAEIQFDYLGLYQQLERQGSLFKQESFANTDVGPDFNRMSLFEITAEILRGEFQLTFEFNTTMKHQAQILRWIYECERCLRSAVLELPALGGQTFTLSDFPLLQTDYDALDTLVTSTLPQFDIPADHVEDIYRTSPMQTGLLLSQAKDEGLYQYFIVFQVEATTAFESVDPQRLADAWENVVKRHASLRTIFVPGISKGDAFNQVVLKSTEPRMARIQCSASELHSVLNERMHLPFQDSRPPHKFTICEAENGETYIRLDINHALVDGSSVAVVVDDFLASYGNIQLPKAPLYSNYMAYIQSCDLGKSLQYWTEYLSGVEPCYLPVLDDGAPQDGLIHTVHVEHQLTVQALSQFCQERNITLPTLFKAVWAILLQTYTGSSQVCFGYLVSGRDVPVEGINEAIGAFINILVCRADLSGTLADVLDRIQDESLVALQHQHCSLAHVQQGLSSAFSQPLFNTAVNFQMQTQAEPRDCPIALKIAHTYDPTEFNVAVDIAICGDTLDISLVHRTSTLSRGQAKNIASSFEAALSLALQAAPTSEASKLQLLSKNHEDQIWAWNSSLPPRVDMCIHDVVARQVSARPTASAIDSWDGSFTYKELDELSSKLARHLTHLGVQPGVMVPLCFEKSAWTIIVLMAVLKAGGAFVLLDPQHISAERTRGIIQDTGAHLLLADEKNSTTLAKEVESIFVVTSNSLESLTTMACCRHEQSRRMKPSPNDPAYVIFTSGTTGKPKGSVTKHSAFCTSAACHGKTTRMSPSTRALQYASYTFDACLMESLTCLMFGGCVCVPTEQRRLDDITGAINDARVNWSVLTPSVTRLINPSDVPTLKTLVMGGEAMSKADIARWKDHLGLQNGYGPSECGIAVAWNDNVLDEPTNIGRSVGGLCWIVDPDNHDRLMSIGAIGELIVEGFSVANGYLNNETKTAEVFIQPPKWLVGKRSGKQICDHLYKTGDLVRYNSDGTMSFIGRKDTQSKFHGQRIEFGEIEHHLLSHSDLISAVAVEVIKPIARQHKQTLVAFFTAENYLGSALTESMFLDLTDEAAGHLQSLQDSLTDSLPSYMIPTVFIPLKEFPRSPSGKLDRKTLRLASERVSAELLNRYGLLTTSKKAPTSEAEKRLQAAWATALGATPSTIGSDTSFFRIGGDSLSAMRLVSIAKEEQGLSLTVADIFNNPRLCDMAKAAEDSREATYTENAILPFTLFGDDDSVDELVKAVAEQCHVSEDRILDVYPCTPLQEGTIALSMTKAGAYVGQTVLRLPQSINITKFKQAWEEVVRKNPILRTRIVTVEMAGNLQAVLDDSIAWQYAASLEEYMKNDMSIPISWGSSLARYAIVGSVTGMAHFVWTAHHALFDGWSQALVFEQLVDAYNGRPLPELTPFNHFIDYLANSDTAACADFWTAQLSGNTPATLPQLPSSSYVPRADQCHTRTISVAQKSTSEIMTSTILRAAWALVTARYSDAEDVVFGATMSGRNAPVHNIARINGPTITTVPVKVHIDRDQSISDFLEGIQTQSTDMIPFEHWGLQNIAQVTKNSQFQNLLVVQPGRDGPTPLGMEIIDVDEADFNTYALCVECILTGDKVKLKMTYDGRVIPYAPQLGSHFEQLVKQLLDRVGDDARISTLNFCSPDDRVQVFGWNRDNPKVVEQCLHDLITRTARSNPDAPAVCSWDCSFSYSELDILSSKIAKHLVTLGVKPEKIVPAVFEKSAWTVVAQLAILKAGGAMCMLDPSNPIQRLEGIIETVESDLVLASEMHSNLLKGRGRTVFTVGPSTMEAISNVRTGTLPKVEPRNAAYVVFTSGTTGKPKGSVTEHRAYASASAALAISMQIGASSRVLQYAAYSFDPYILETFTTLIEGGCVCIVKDDARTNPTELVDTICALGVTWALLTPSVARLLPKDAVPSLKTLILGGEAMARSDKAWSNYVTLMNAYGPSECSVASVLNTNVTAESEHTTIGKAVGGRCWIVEPHDHNSLAPVGCVGELLLESPGLSRGYLKEPKKTADVFITSPNWLKNIRGNSRLYKTGDLVRYNPTDGTINFIGRKDMQVKLHGQRLELGEIEHHLSAHSHVENVAVTLPKSGNFKGKLVATLSLKSLAASKAGDIELELVDSLSKATAARQLSEVRTHLENQVPSYMVPSVWTVVYGIPLTTSLKINKRKITTWLENLSEDLCREVMNLNNAEEPTRAPTTSMERRLQDIIARVLNLPVEQIQLNRSFIGLGGDSITAMQVMARCRTENISVKIRDILQSKTIVQLAECSTEEGGEETKFEKESTGTAFSLTPIQRLYFDAGLGSSRTSPAHFNQSTLVQLKKKVSVEKLAQAVEAIVRAHSMLRARFTVVDDGAWNQLIRADVSKSYTFRHHALRSSVDMASIIAASQRHLDPENGAVFSVDSFQISSEEHLLFLAAHHLVIDLVSWRIILQDLEEFLNTGKLFTKDPLSFQTWAKLQEQFAAQNLQPEKLMATFDVPASEYNYWGIDAHANVFGDTITASFSLDTTSTTALLGSCNNCFGTEPTDLFISALLDSFARVFTDRGVPPVYCEGHGREPWDDKIDLSGTVGWFTTIYPLNVQLATGAGILDAVRRTKDARRRIPSNGWSYFASRFLTPNGSAAFRNHWPMEILFNYMGLYQQLERADALLQEVPVPGTSDGSLAATADVGAHCRRLALFDISAQVNDGKAAFTFTYNQYTPQAPRIREWMYCYEDTLKAVVAELATKSPEPTLTDFPLVSLTYDSLEKIRTETLPAIGISGFNQVSDIYPCAPTQKGILLSQARSAGNYQESFLFSATSQSSEPVDMSRLMTAWQKVVARHATLRTVFIENDDDAYSQLVLQSWLPRMLHFEAREEDAFDTLSSIPPATMSAMEPSHRMIFCQTNKRVYISLEISHTLIDGASMGVLLRDLNLAYEGKLSLHSANLPLYKDYVAHIKNLPMDKSIAYWQKYLKNAQPCHFPTLREGQVHGGEEVELIPVKFDAKDDTITSFCRAHSLTPANIFQVAWALVLRAYTGMDQICFGYLTSGRDAPVPRIEEVIGAVCNMLVFRMDFDRSKTVSELLQIAQDGWTSSLNHQFVSLADIQHGLGNAGQALFNTGISFRSEGRDAGEATSTALSIEFVNGHDPSEFDATVNIWGSAMGFQASFTYRPSCMTREQAENVVFTLNMAVKNIIDGCDRTLGDWCLVKEHDLGRAPAYAPPRPVHSPADGLVDEIISMHTQIRPDSQAVCSWDGNLMYWELDELSSRLSNQLIALGVGPEILVPVCMEKSVWFIVAILAIMKAGGAFVPMDATQPGRFQTIIQQTGARLVLTSAGQWPRISKLTAVALVVDANLVQKFSPGMLPQWQRTPTNAAYVLFTSGSTGNPKGVVVEHRAWCSSAMGQEEAWGLDERTRMLQFASYGFDASMGEMLTTLMVGGCVCIPSETERLNDVETAIRRMGVNITIFSPSFIKVLTPENIPAVHTMILGGESTPEDEIRKWGAKVRLIPAYGPTECSLVSSSVERLTLDTKPSNIGFPNTSRYWVVDATDHNILLPAGAVGELLIEGPIVARGYLNNPTQTAAAFIENPAWAWRDFSETRRMYKTGDLVQLNQDGSYRCIGRKDTQVKVHGQRIELGEVEHHLKRALDGDYTVAAEVLKNGKDTKLLGFIALEADYDGDQASGLITDLTKQRLQEIVAGVASKMAESVPSYMIPSVFIPLRTIPLSPSCKTDRKQLRQIAAGMSSADFAALSHVAITSKRTDLTAVERRMRDIWATVLGIESASISPDSSFFSQGGDSVLAIKLVSACRSAGLVVSVADILRNPTLEAMCRGLGGAVMAERKVYEPLSSLGSLNNPAFVEQVICPQVSTRPENIEDIVEATTSQSSFVSTGLLKSRGNTNYFAFQLTGSINANQLWSACRKLVAKHPILRTAFVAFKRRVFQVVLRKLEPEFRTYQCAKWRQAHMAAKLVKADQGEPVTLGQTIVRFFLLDGGKQSLLIMRISHAQYDGMSIPVLIDDLGSLYEGQDVPDRPVFTEFVHASGEYNEKGAEEYWYKLLEGSTMTNIISHKTPPYQNAKLKTVSREIAAPPQSGNMTFATVLKAAWALVLAEISSSTDVVFGHLISGRNLSVGGADVNEILGPCLNLVPVRVQFGADTKGTGTRRGATTVHDILRQVYDQQLAAIPFETLGLDHIVERCTDWPLWTRFSTVVQHQNLDGVEDVLRKFRFGDATCRFGAFQGAQDAVDILVLSTPKSGGARVDVAMHFSDKVLAPDFVADLLDRLLANIAILATSDADSTPLPDLRAWTAAPPQIPMLARGVRDAAGGLAASAAMEADRTLAAVAASVSFDADVPAPARDLVRAAWRFILEPVADQAVPPDTEVDPSATTAFYNVWGSLVAAAQFAEFYNARLRAGVSVTVEEMVDCPSMLAQGVLLADRLGTPIAGKKGKVGKGPKKISSSRERDSEGKRSESPRETWPVGENMNGARGADKAEKKKLIPWGRGRRGGGLKRVAVQSG